MDSAVSDWVGDIHCGDCRTLLDKLPADTVDCVVTSPPYWGLRDYDIDGQVGLEDTRDEYLQEMVTVTKQIQRVLKPTGSLWINVGDCYASSGGGRSTAGYDRNSRDEFGEARNQVNRELPEKCRMLLPERVATAIVDDGGWILRNPVVWEKANPAPEPHDDRLTKSYEKFHHFVQQQDYYYDLDPVRTASGANPGEVFTIAAPSDQPIKSAVMPVELAEIAIQTSCPPNGVVLDPFCGSGTVCEAAHKHGRNWIGFDLNPDHVAVAQQRLGVSVDEPERVLEDRQTTLDFTQTK